MKRTMMRGTMALAALVAVFALALGAQGADIIKANNTTALVTAGSFTTSPILNDGSEVAVWDSTVTAANTVALGGNLNLSGIRIANPGGAVIVTHVAGNVLTLGSGGIDMSGANNNLTLLNSANIAGNIAIGANQTWNVASGRTLQLFSNSNTANQRLTGSGNIEITGGGIVRVLTGDAGSTTFTAGNGNDTYSGNWTITSGTVRGLRNGTHAWGTGAITMNGGTLGQEQGGWTWSNNITLNASTTSTFDDFNTSNTNRALKLQGIISGSGNLNINDTSNRMDANTGFVLTGANTMSGTITVGASGNLRVGGVTGNDTSLGAGTGGTLGTAGVNLNAASAALTFSRSDAHTVANAISGTGVVNVGSAVSGAGTQVLTLSGTSTYTGATTVGQGRLNLTGSLTSAVTVSNGAKISGTGSTTGLLTLSSGGGIALAGGGTYTSLTVNGATFSGSNLVTFLTAPTASTTYDVFTYGTGTVTTPGNLSVDGRGTLSDDTTNKKYTFAATGGATRTWNTTTGTWDLNTTANFAEGDQKFMSWDDVVFGDIASDSVVTLSGTLSPNSVTVGNSANKYTFQTGVISGATGLTKSNAGTLVVTSDHTYTGTTTVSGGVLDVGNGGTTGALGSGAISVALGAELVFSRSNDTTVSNVISGAGLVTKKGAGRITVNGDSSGGVVNWNFTGTGNGNIGFQNAKAIGGTGSTITLAASATGSAFFATSGNTSDVDVSLGSGAVLTWNGITGNTNTLSGDISGSGALTKVSGETLILSGTNSYSGNTTITTGTLEIGGSGVLGNGNYAGTITISNATKFSYNSTTDQTLAGDISGAGQLVKSNSGTLTLSGVNTYSGNTTISGGTLSVTGNGVLYSGAYRPSVLTVGSGATLELKNWGYDQNNNTTSLGGLAADASSFVINGGTVRIVDTSATSYGRGVTVNSGGATLEAATGANWTIDTVNDNTAWTFTGNPTLTLTGAGTGVFQKVINSGSGSVTKSGTGTWTLSGSNSYTGATSVNNGTLVLSTGNNRLPTAGSVILGGTSTSGKLVLGDGTGAISQTLAGLTITGNGGSVVGGNASNSTLTLNIASSNTFGGTLGGGGTNENKLALTKSGAGILDLQGVLSYNGPTEVQTGTLLVNNNSNSGLGLITVDSGATLGGAGTVQNVTILGGGILAPGNSPGTLTTGTLTLADTSISKFELNPTDQTVGSNINDLVIVTGDLTLDGLLNVTATSGNFLSAGYGATWRLFNYTGTLSDNTLSLGTMPSLSGSLTWSVNTATANEVNLTVIPEPATFSLLGAAAFAAIWRRRKAMKS